MRYKYTEEDIQFLKENYPKGNWNNIFERFPNLTKSSIHKKCHRLGIKSKNTHRIGFNNTANRVYWSDEEIQILKDMYSKIPMDKLLLL